MAQLGYALSSKAHQIGPDQDTFFDFYQKQILPEFMQMAR